MAINEELYEGQKQSIRTDQAISTNPLPRLTAQEQMLVAAMNAGASVTEAARRAGMTPAKAKKWLEREDLQQALGHYRDEFERDILPNVVFNRDDAHHMYMSAYRQSGNATEMIKATDSLVKLHRLNEPEARAPERELNSSKQLEHLTIHELLKLADYKIASLNPEDIEDAEVGDDA